MKRKRIKVKVTLIDKITQNVNADVSRSSGKWSHIAQSNIFDGNETFYIFSFFNLWISPLK